MNNYKFPDTSVIVDGLLEGKGLSDFLMNPNRQSLIGKKLLNCDCPDCNVEDSLVVTDVKSDDQNFYIVTVHCTECNSDNELEIVLRSDSDINAMGEAIQIKGRGKIFTAISEAVSVGNFVKLIAGSLAYAEKIAKSLYSITFKLPAQDYFIMNDVIVFKVTDVSGDKVKIISTMNDNVNNISSGTIFSVNKSDFNNFKYVKPRSR